MCVCTSTDVLRGLTAGAGGGGVYWWSEYPMFYHQSLGLGGKRDTLCCMHVYIYSVVVYRWLVLYVKTAVCWVFVVYE